VKETRAKEEENRWMRKKDEEQCNVGHLRRKGNEERRR